MTKQALIDFLINLQAPADAEVVFFNGDSGKNEAVTGAVYGGSNNTIELCNDDPND